MIRKLWDLFLPVCLVFIHNLMPWMNIFSWVSVQHMIDDITEHFKQGTDNKIEKTCKIKQFLTQPVLIFMSYQFETGELGLYFCHTKVICPDPSPSPYLLGWRTPPCTLLSTPCEGPMSWWDGIHQLSVATNTSLCSYQSCQSHNEFLHLNYLKAGERMNLVKIQCCRWRKSFFQPFTYTGVCLLSGPGTTISLPCFSFFHCFMALLENL